MSSDKKNSQTVDFTVKLEQNLIKDLEVMAKNSGKSVEELVAVAIKRFRSSHADYMGIKLDYP